MSSGKAGIWISKMKSKNPKTVNLICILILGLLPVISILLRTIISPAAPSLLTSEWNDELFYFKQVEAIIDYGYPLGYYGFNESHALAYSFAAWSPVLVWPWVLLGSLFGWSLNLVFIYNLIIYILAMLAFGALTKPTPKQTAVISIWFLSFFLNARYIFSGMPEVICFAHLIVYFGLITGFIRLGKKGFLYTAIFVSMLMTFMRPYLILFLIFALIMNIVFSAKKGKKAGIFSFVISGIIFLITGFIYYLLNHYLSAEYLMPFFFTDFITTFFTDGFSAGVHNLIGTLYYKGMGYIEFMRDAFYVDRAAGIFFCLFILLMAVQAVQAIFEGREVKKKAKEKAIGITRIRWYFYSRLYMLFACFALLMAILLMYKLTEGSKHLLTFIMAGTLLMILDEKRGLICGIVMSLALIYFGIFHCRGNFYDFGIPVRDAVQDARYDYWEKAFAEGIEIDKSDVPSYKNAIIWEFGDKVDDKDVVTDYQMLYALPSGTGISCCMEYTADNLDKVQCRYIAAPAGGRIDKLCAEAGFKEIGRDERLVAYARY